ncbi:phage tail assembly chaperone [Yersinia pseudotuberculosis]|uniref:phage tail assembly chaperone n=1 Tax=Yersinia pseudotuberculosis TaxID=633 RepID=UPI003993663F
MFAQLKVSRKLLPLLAGIVKDLRSGTVTIETALPSIAQSLSDISEEDCNAIIHPCLERVSRKNGSAYNPIFTGGEVMFDDIDLMAMLQIVGRVVGDSMGNFLRELQESEPLALSAD